MFTKQPARFIPEDSAQLDDVDAAELIAATSWYHRFELRPGLVSPGGSDMYAAAALNALGVPEDLTGKKVLDIGAWDGPLTFEMERRGAAAYALDIQKPTNVGFATAKRVMQSKAEHYQGSVYQLPSDDLSGFDHIVFRGVFYHLKYPLLAFECMSAAMKKGGSLHFEGEGFVHYAEKLGGAKATGLNLAEFAASDIPICLTYPNEYKNASNWSIPNKACIRSWLQASGFVLKDIQEYVEGGAQRLYGRAEKVSDTSAILEHPLY